MQKRKTENTGEQKKKPQPDNSNRSLYYIASHENLLKGLTMSFYNTKTRKNNKNVVFEDVKMMSFE